MNFDIFSRLGEKKVPLNSHLNGSKETIYVINRRFLEKKRIEKYVIHFDWFFFIYSFCGLTTNYGIFSKLDEKK
jgi:hypothetical protein